MERRAEGGRNEAVRAAARDSATMCGMRSSPAKVEDMTDDHREPPTEDNGRFSEVATREADVEAPTQEVVRRGGTFESFRERDFSLFWSGALVSNVGTWMQNAALAIVVYAFRHSETDSGIMNFAAGIPVLFLALYAGSLADRIDRKQLIIATQTVLLVQAAAFGWLYESGHLSGNIVVSMTWVVGLSLIGGVMSALAFPAWQSILPDLVPRDSLLNAIALNSAQFQSARLLGPLVTAGLILVGVSYGGIFYINAASFLFVIAALWAVHPRKMVRHISAEEESGWKRLTAGIKYAREHEVVGVIIISTAIMTVFGMAYMTTLLPAFVDKSLGFGGAVNGRYVAIVLSANGLGAVVSALIVASLPHGVRRENLMRYSLLAMAVLLIGFSRTHSLWLALPLSAAVGAALLTTNSLANTSIQATVPNQLRGRVMSLFVMSFMGLMPMSALVFGPLGSLIGPGNAILAGAVVLLAWAIALFVRPGLLLPEHR
jgi:MFS family permease